MISIIVPAYNEEKRIGKSLDKIISFFEKNKRDYEVIVVDDGSRDRTREIAESFKVKLNKKRRNRGKGYSVKEGMLMAEGDNILFTDADLSAPIEEIDKLMKYSGRYEVIVASRALKESVIEQPKHRRLMGMIYNGVVQILAVPGIKDTQCGFKLFSKKAAKKIFGLQRLPGFAFDVEVLFIARKKGFKIKEVPVVWKNASGTKVSLIKDSLKMFGDIIKIRMNGIRGCYK